METIMRMFRAEHVGVREYREELSERINTTSPIVLTVKGEPKQFVIPHDEMLKMLEIMADQERKLAFHASKN